MSDHILFRRWSHILDTTDSEAERKKRQDHYEHMKSSGFPPEAAHAATFHERDPKRRPRLPGFRPRG